MIWLIIIVLIDYAMIHYYVQIWHDEFLMWEPQDYDNITQLAVPFGNVWSPEFSVSNRYV